MPAKSSHSERAKQLGYLFDMLESARLVARYTEGVSFDAFLADNQKRDAVSLRLSLIGEAARHVDNTTAACLVGVPFPEIRGMRNRIVHEYGQVDFRIVWDVAQKNVPALVSVIGEYLAKQEKATT